MSFYVLLSIRPNSTVGFEGTGGGQVVAVAQSEHVLVTAVIGAAVTRWFLLDFPLEGYGAHGVEEGWRQTSYQSKTLH